MGWADSLQTASFRGVPFGVRSGSVVVGRNTASHDYPFRDKDSVWVEDIGLARRRFRLAGFLVGDDVVLQQEAMLAAVEAPGPAPVVHPLLGSLTAAVVAFDARFAQERGRCIELEFDLVETALKPPQFPTPVVNTQAATQAAAVAAKPSILADLKAGISTGVQAVRGAIGEVQAFGNRVLAVAHDASSALNAVKGLATSVGLGRYVKFLNKFNLQGVTSPIDTVKGVLSRVTTTQATVTRSVTNLTALVRSL